MRGVFVLLLIIGVVLFSSFASAFSVHSSFGLVTKSSSKISHPDTESYINISSVVTKLEGSRSTSLSPNEMTLLLGGGRRYDYLEKKWSVFKPSGTYRENLLLSYIRNRDRVRANIPPQLYAEMVSK